VKRATEALVHEAQTRTRDAQGNVKDDVDAAAGTSVTVSGSRMVTGMAQVISVFKPFIHSQILHYTVIVNIFINLHYVHTSSYCWISSCIDIAGK